MAERIQRKRTKGWRVAAEAVYVGRGTKWGKVADALNAAGVPTAQGGRQWYPATVRKIEQRLG